MDVVRLGKSLNFSIHHPYFIVTYHPVTLGDEDPEKSFQAILDALDSYPEYQVILTYPNADDGGRRIIPMLEAYAASNPNRVLAIPSLGQVRYLSAIKNSAAVIGNSSSGIVEVPSFDVPTVNIGVRQKGRLAAKSVLNAEPNTPSICSAINGAIAKDYKVEGEAVVNPYGQGNASEQLLQMIKDMKFNPCKQFFDIK